MARKKFSAAPRPAAAPVDQAAVDQYINHGHGREIEKTETQKSVKVEKQIPAPTARLTVDMPRDLHRKFKAACASQGAKMNDEIRTFIEARIAEIEGE